MNRLIEIVGATVLILGVTSCATNTQPVAYSGAESPTRISFKSYTPGGIDQILEDKWRVNEVTIHGDLYAPSGDGPHPAVIIQHGSDHVRHYREWLAELIPLLSESGVAAFVLDSYTARGISATMADQTKLPKEARMVDAYRALEVLADRDDIDADRIGITGYSFGGIVALQTAHRGVTNAVTDGAQFAAHLPAYPLCIARYEEVNYTDAPVWIIAAELDDYTPAKPCREYARDLRAQGYDVRFTSYDGMHHGFIGDADNYFCSDCFTLRDCDRVSIDENGQGSYTTAEGRTITTENGWDAFNRELFAACGTTGVTIDGNPQGRQRLLTDTVDFFKREL